MPTFILQKKAVGSQLLEQVFYHLDIIEKDYFGLQFTDPYNVQHWLDPTKLVKKQVKSEYIFLVGMNVPLFLKWPHGEKKGKKHSRRWMYDLDVHPDCNNTSSSHLAVSSSHLEASSSRLSEVWNGLAWMQELRWLCKTKVSRNYLRISKPFLFFSYDHF